MSERTREAVAAATAVVREAGLDVSEAAILREAWHVLVHLRPLPLVARVSAAATSPEIDPEQVRIELAVAAHAAAAGAPVVPPADLLDPGPHERGGRIVSFWRFVEQRGDLSVRAAGEGLRATHEALADYDGPLPPAGHPEAMEAMLEALAPSPDADLLRRASALRPRGAGQALHGDAHLGNCMQTSSGPLWHDFETACRGPREYDLAALLLRERVSRDLPAARVALEAYGEHEPELLDAWLPVYGAWVCASLLLALPRRPELRPALDKRLAWLRGQLAGEPVGQAREM